MIRLPGTATLLMSQPLSTQGRVNMTVHASIDSGDSWHLAIVVDQGPAGYSAMAGIDGSAVGLAWESAGSIQYQTLAIGGAVLACVEG